MESIGFLMRLRPGCRGEYQKRHENLWPEMHAALRDHNVSMVIFRYEDQLMVHIWVPTKESWTRIGEHPVVARWNAHMTDLLETDEHSGIQFNHIPLVFSFGQFAD